MSVIPLTLFFSLLLAGLFIGLFVCEQRRRRFGSLERDSLLPLAEEGTTSSAAPVDAPHSHDHDGHGDEACGCRTGKRAPCPGCLKRLRPSAPSIS
jgi:hypothetical protein